MITPSPTHPHQHNAIIRTPSTDTTPSPHHQRHNTIITPASKHHHLHTTMNTTASTQHHRSITNIPSRQHPPKQHPHNIIYTTPCMHEKGLILTPLFSSAGKSQKGSVTFVFGQNRVIVSEKAIVKKYPKPSFFSHNSASFSLFFALFCRLFPLLRLLDVSPSSLQHHLHITINTKPSSEHHRQATINTQSATHLHPDIRRASSTHSSSYCLITSPGALFVFHVLLLFAMRT